MDHSLPCVDIKADNVFINWQNHDDDEIFVDQVQLGDLQDAAHVLPEYDMIGKQTGNWMWSQIS